MTDTNTYRAQADVCQSVTTLRRLVHELADRAGALDRALRRLSFAAQTTGGTAGPDHGLRDAIAEAERVLTDQPADRYGDKQCCQNCGTPIGDPAPVVMPFCSTECATAPTDQPAQDGPMVMQPGEPSQRRCFVYCGDDRCTCDAGRVPNSDQPADVGEPFQSRVWPWLIHCFGEQIARDGRERNHRFLEEALELVQSTGCTASEAHQLVDYVFGRPVGEPHQETGGVMVTLAALCLAHGLDMHAAGEDELTRVWGKADKIRAKQAAKPAHGPLPGPSEPADAGEPEHRATLAVVPDGYYGWNVTEDSRIVSGPHRSQADAVEAMRARSRRTAGDTP
jgi:hypothetical protein